MVFLRQHDPESDKGEWVRIGEDNGEPVEVRVRAVPESKQRTIEGDYGTEKDVANEYHDERNSRKGTFHIRQRIHSSNDYREIARDKAKYAWLDTRNFTIEALDEAQAKRYQALLKDPAIVVGTPFSLDGRLNDAIKHYILENNRDLASEIWDRADKLSVSLVSKEGALRKN